MSKPVRTGYCHRHRANVVDDSCEQCNDENPRVERTFRGSISLHLNELTENGEYSEETGWEYLQKDLDKAISNQRPYKGDAEFIEWEE